MRGVPRDPAELLALRDSGLTQGQAARILGTSRQNVGQIAQRYGIEWRRPAPIKRPPPKKSWSRQPPPVYRLGVSMSEWEMVLELLDEISLEVGDRIRARYRTSSRTGIPYGAIAAADRGEWWRLE